MNGIRLKTSKGLGGLRSAHSRTWTSGCHAQYDVENFLEDMENVQIENRALVQIVRQLSTSGSNVWSHTSTWSAHVHVVLMYNTCSFILQYLLFVYILLLVSLIHCVWKKGIPYGNMKTTSKYSSIFKIPKPF